jgi:hypothetical protein
MAMAVTMAGSGCMLEEMQGATLPKACRQAKNGTKKHYIWCQN